MGLQLEYCSEIVKRKEEMVNVMRITDLVVPNMSDKCTNFRVSVYGMYLGCYEMYACLFFIKILGKIKEEVKHSFLNLLTFYSLSGHISHGAFSMGEIDTFISRLATSLLALGKTGCV